MADTQEQVFDTITPVDGDYFRAVDDPGGTPVSSNVTGTALKAYLKTYNDTLYYGVANVAYVTSDFSVTSSTTLVDVTGLTFTLASGGVYKFRAVLLISCHASGGANVGSGGTATATDSGFTVRMYSLNTLERVGFASPIGKTASVSMIEVDGWIDVDEGGTYTLQFAQNASYGTASIVLNGSWMQMDKIA